MFNVNPKQLKGMMKSMGISQEEIDAEEVIIKTAEKNIVIKPADVVKIEMQGQETFQISGEIHEEEIDESIEIDKDDIKTVVEKTGCSEKLAREYLEKNEGDIIKTIKELKK